MTKKIIKSQFDEIYYKNEKKESRICDFYYDSVNNKIIFSDNSEKTMLDREFILQIQKFFTGV